MAAKRPFYTVNVEGLEKLGRLPGQLTDAQHDFLSDLADELAEEVAKKAPGGPSGSIGRSVFGQVIVPDKVARVASRHPGARAQELGAYIVNRRSGRPIRFSVSGKTVFARFARIPATRFMRKGLRGRSRLAQSTFARHFGELAE